MSDLEQAVQYFKGTLEPKRDVLSGWMVDAEGIGSAKVSDNPGHVYVLLDRGGGASSGHEVIEVYSRVRPVAGWGVLIGVTRWRPWEYSVLDVDTEAMGGAIDGKPFIEPHHETHEWNNPEGGDDSVFPMFLQLYDFGIWPYDGLTLVADSGIFDPSGTVQEFPITEIDMSGTKPESDQRYVLICLSPTGTIELVPGTIKEFLTLEDIPPAPSLDHWRLAAVRIRSTDTEIVHTPGNQNIVDLRFSKLGWPRCWCEDGGATGSCCTYLSLEDTPASYVGQAGRFVTVNDIENGLEFSDCEPTGTRITFLQLDDTPGSYVGKGGYAPLVSEIENQLEFVDVPTQAEYDAHVADSEAHQDLVTVVDSNSVDLTLAGQQLTADVIRKAGGHISEDAGGIYVPDATDAVAGAVELTDETASPAEVTDGLAVNAADAPLAPAADRVVRLDSDGHYNGPDEGLVILNGAADGNIWRLGETQFDLDFTGTDFDTKAECQAYGIRFSDDDTPFPDEGISVYDNDGDWTHSAGRGWYASGMADGKGATLMFPLYRAAQWCLEMWLDLDDIALNTGAYAMLGAEGVDMGTIIWAWWRIGRKVLDSNVYALWNVYTNDGDDTYTDQTGHFTKSNVNTTYKIGIRLINQIFQFYDDQADTWQTATTARWCTTEIAGIAYLLYQDLKWAGYAHDGGYVARARLQYLL